MQNSIKNKEVLELIEKKLCPVYNIFIYFIYGISILLNILIIISLFKVEKINCNCSNIPEKQYLKEWFIFNAIFNLLFLISFLLSDKACYYYLLENSFIYVIIFVINIITFIQLIRLLSYLNIMRSKCECGYGNLEAFLFWYFIIIFSLIGLLLVMGIILGLIGIIKFGF